MSETTNKTSTPDANRMVSEEAYLAVVETCRGLSHALLAARDMVRGLDNVLFIDRALADPAMLVHLKTDTQSQAAHDVLAERQRQVDAEGWTPAHDDQYQHGQLGRAAACYAAYHVYPEILNLWPWSLDWWKPADNRRNMVKAGALILAAIERLDRAAMAAAQQDAKGGA